MHALVDEALALFPGAYKQQGTRVKRHAAKMAVGGTPSGSRPLPNADHASVRRPLS